MAQNSELQATQEDSIAIQVQALEFAVEVGKACRSPLKHTWQIPEE